MIKCQAAFTVDVEDGISLAMRDAFSVTSKQTNRVVSLTQRILELLNQYDISGTFFVLGQVAEKFPGLVKQIADGGHEVGVHGYDHLQFFRMTPAQAFNELDRAKKLLEDVSGQKVKGHRAPAFSITPETKWGLDVIADAGFKYDSSVMPINGIRYGWPGYRKDIHTITTVSGKELIEVPLSSFSFMGKEIPACGGGYFRLYPFWFTRFAFERINKKRPAILYLHPYEIDTEKYPEYYFYHLNKSSFTKRFRMKSMWINRKSVQPKLEACFQRYRFCKLNTLVEDLDQSV